MCTHHCTLIKTHRLIDRNKCATLVRELILGVWMGLGSIWEISTFHSISLCDLKLLFKQSIFEKVPEPYEVSFLFTHLCFLNLLQCTYIDYFCNKILKIRKERKHYQSIHTVLCISKSVSGRM